MNNLKEKRNAIAYEFAAYKFFNDKKLDICDFYPPVIIGYHPILVLKCHG